MRRKKVYLIVDGYNIINNWPNLKRQMSISLESARLRLMDIMAEYAKMSDEKVIVVFDAHQVKGSVRKFEKYKGIEVVYTKELETADQYIERRLDLIGRRELVKVATSDSMIQRIILGRGGIRISASELKHIVYSEKSKTKRIESRMRKIKDRNLVCMEDKNLKTLNTLMEMIEKEDRRKKR
ncbi:MAG: NYN domain-containing protein [Tissierellia bacterium]|nr:NYN domain-containing protein [Tissierellia bacterium]